MKESSKQIQFRKSKRLFSDLQRKLSQYKNLQDPYLQNKDLKPKTNSIKINRNKLPPDFFPRTQSVRKKVTSHKPSLHQERLNTKHPSFRKVQSQKSSMTPDKTSFFGFFEEESKQKRSIGNSLSIKRQFQSRNQAKRQKIYDQYRNLTPMTGANRHQFLQMYPANYDQTTFQILNSKKMKSLFASPRIQKIGQQKYKMQEDPQYSSTKQKLQLQQQNKYCYQDIKNITFFNSKSTSLPPICKNTSMS